jgi:chemotaxis protein CheC
MLESEKIGNVNVVVIQVESEKYLLEVKDVKEIYLPGDKIIPIPLADRNIVGIIDIRGILYTIMSLKNKIYDKDGTFNLNEDSRIILLELENLHLALLVDKVIGVRKLPVSIFEAQNTIVETHIDYRFIKSIGVKDDVTYILLDLNTLIPPEILSMEAQPVKIKRQVSAKQPRQIKRSRGEDEVVIPRVPKMDGSRAQLGDLLKTRKPKKVIKELQLTDDQQDTLKEVGNIGSGNAVTALSRLIKKKVDVDLTNVGIVSFDKLPKLFGGKNKKVCGIFCHLENSQSTILQAFELRGMMSLVSNLVGKESKFDPKKVESKDELDDFAISTIKEMGNIMAGHYASALADLTGTKMMIDLPEFTMTNVESLGSFLNQDVKSLSRFIILIKTSIQVVDLELNGVFFFIPDMKTLYKIFGKLDIEYESLLEQEGIETKRLSIDDIVLSETQRDALQEVGNIGAGNAANALAKMINQRVDINIPSVEMIKLDEFTKEVSNEKEYLFIAWSNVEGKTRATVLTLFKVDDIIDLTSIIVDDKKKKGIDLRKSYRKAEDFPDLYADAMKELGHILASNYTSAIADLLDIRLMTNPPDMNVDEGKKLFNLLKDEIGILKKLSLVITTNVIVTDIKITGTFLFIPELETLENLLEALKKYY